MKIDPATGALDVEGVLISPATGWRELSSWLLTHNAKEVVRNGKWVTFSVRLKGDKNEIGIHLVLRDERLVEIVFSIATAGESWGSWSKEGEHQKKVKIDGILKESLGNPPYSFDWGEIISEIDPRDGFSYAVIRYRE